MLAETTTRLINQNVIDACVAICNKEVPPGQVLRRDWRAPDPEHLQVGDPVIALMRGWRTWSVVVDHDATHARVAAVTERGLYEANKGLAERQAYIIDHESIQARKAALAYWSVERRRADGEFLTAEQVAAGLYRKRAQRFIEENPDQRAYADLMADRARTHVEAKKSETFYDLVDVIVRVIKIEDLLVKA